MNALFLFIVSLIGATTTAQSVVRTPVQPGVWKAIIGKPEAYKLLTAGGAKSYVSTLAMPGNAPFSLDKPAMTARVAGDKTYLRFLLDRTEQLYSFGLNFHTVHQRGAS